VAYITSSVIPGRRNARISSPSSARRHARRLSAWLGLRSGESHGESERSTKLVRRAGPCPRLGHRERPQADVERSDVRPEDPHRLASMQRLPRRLSRRRGQAATGVVAAGRPVADLRLPPADGHGLMRWLVGQREGGPAPDGRDGLRGQASSPETSHDRQPPRLPPLPEPVAGLEGDTVSLRCPSIQ
jgi:hypothetical protein